MKKELKEHLMLLAERYETPAFILDDPIQIPHHYTSFTDIEISALVTSWIATGNRKAILKSAQRIYHEIFGHAPYEYIMKGDWKIFAGQKDSFYRYYSYDDFFLLCRILHEVYTHHESIGRDLARRSRKRRLCLVRIWSE